MKNVNLFIKRAVCVLFVLLTLSTGLFAGFSGSTGMTLSYNFDDNSYGFNRNNTSAKFDFNLLGVSDISGGDGSVKAQVEAYLTLYYNFENTGFSGKDGFTFNLDNLTGQFRLEDASIYGPGWEFSLVWIPGQLDYAKSPIDYTVNEDDTLNNATATMLYNKAPGVYFKWHDNEVGFGIEGDSDNYNITVYGQTQRFLFSNGLAMRFGGFYSSANYNGMTQSPALGASGKIGYYGNLFQLYLAADTGFTFLDDTVDFKADIMGSAYFGFIGIDAYYATTADVPGVGSQQQYLSGRITADLDSAGLPVRLGFTIKDILAKQDMELSIGYAISKNFLAEVHGGYTIASNGRVGDMIQGFNSYYKRIGAWSAGASVSFEDDTLMTAEAGIDLEQILDDSEIILSAYGEVSSKAIISGAELKLRYDADDLTHASSDSTENGDLGALSLSCMIEW